MGVAEPQSIDPLHPLGEVFDLQRIGSDPVGHEHQTPRRRDAGIELPQAPRRRIARVGKQRFAAAHPLLVDLLEILFENDHFSPYLDPSRIGDGEGNALDRFGVLGDVLPLYPITPRDRLHELAVLIDQVETRPVEFRLAVEADIPVPFGDAVHPRLQLVTVKQIFEAPHTAQMLRLLELILRHIPYPLCR